MAEPEEDLEKPDKPSESDDSLVPVFKLDGPRLSQGTILVPKSELIKNPNLIRASKKIRALNFDLEKIAAPLTQSYLPADTHVKTQIQNKLMPREIKQRIQAENIDLESIANHLEDVKSIDEDAVQMFLALVTDELKANGKWRDEDKDLTMSEAFPLSQAKLDPRLGTAHLKEFEEGTFLSDSDLTHDDQSAGDTKNELSSQTRTLHGPSLSTPMLHNLMRANPRDLHHQIARRMIDTHYFDGDQKHQRLHRACYFSSKGVRDENHFQMLMDAGLNEQHPHYTFDEFKVDSIPLKKLFEHFIDQFFAHHPAVKRQLSTNEDIEKQNTKNVWSRFFKAWDRLTRKQKEALEKVYMDQDSLTKEQAAVAFGISVDSLNTRLKTAILRFRQEFPEFCGMTPPSIPRKLLTGTVTHNGLWRYQSAIWKAQLYKIDLKTGIRVEIEWRKLPKSKNFDSKTIARIKAEIIENCPIPYFHETEYFDGMKPTILSFGRIPGNVKKK